MGQAMVQADLEYNIHKCAYTPIHTYIAHIIPFLEHRQACAKRLIENKGKGFKEQDDNLKRIIINCNSSISEILNFIPHDHQTHNSNPSF